MKKIISNIILLFLLFIAPKNLFADCSETGDCYDVNYATFTGDFREGGDADTAERLLGNTSYHAFGIIQNNVPRIFIGSGTRNGGYSLNDSTPSTAGYVGIWTDGVTQIPQYPLDVWGQFRSTGSAYLATSTGNVGIGTTQATSKLDILGGSVTVRGSGAALGVAGTITANSFSGDGSGLTGIIASASTENSTHTFVITGFGSVFVATDSFIPISGAFQTLAKTTWNIIELQPFTLNTSTVGSSIFRLAHSSVTDNSNYFTYISPYLEVSTGNRYGIWTSTKFTINAGTSFSLHTTTVPAVGNTPENYGVMGRFWSVREQ